MTRGLGIAGRFRGGASAGTGKTGTGATIRTGTSMETRWKTDMGMSSAADGATIGEAATTGAAGGIATTGAITAEDGDVATITDTVMDTIMVMATKEEQSATRKAPGTGPFCWSGKGAEFRFGE